MTASSDQDDDLRRAFFAGAERPSPAGGCPSADLLWAAATGELAPAERRLVIDHSASCAACAEDFRIVAAMARARPAEARAVPAGGGMVVAGPWTARPKNRRLAGSLAAAFFLAAILAAVLGRSTLDLPPRVYRGAGDEVVSLLGPEPALARDAAALRWEGPPGSRYEITVTTADLRLVAEASDLLEPAYTLGPELLLPYAAGERFHWRVVAILPDGRRISSPTFLFRLR